MSPNRRPEELRPLVAARVAAVATALGESLTPIARALHVELAEAIPELRGDPLILDLLRASTESNVETFVHIAKYDIPVEEVRAPSAALEYARRLAQRGTSSNALLRAYRIGQQSVFEWATAEISREERDADVRLAAILAVQRTAFSYVDRIAEQIVEEYESERERWVAHRTTVRTTVLRALLAGESVEIAAAESALGLRLRQHHLGLVAWSDQRQASTTQLHRLEQLVHAVAATIPAAATPLFIPHDRSLCWAWIPLGRAVPDIDEEPIRRLVESADGDLRLALGTPGAALSGFRSSHLEAQRAQTVATMAGDRALSVTSYSDAQVRTAALLAADLPMARDLVARALGPLAADDAAAERLRETLLAFLSEGGSYVSTGARIHLHKNTVRYRVEKALELRGRGLDDDRLDLELGLVACRWLGPSVLLRS